MPDVRRPLTLLQLAIAATAAVVPVLLGVLLVVASARRGDDADAARGSERHVSVRHVAALKTFESAIVAKAFSKPALIEASGELPLRSSSRMRS